MDKSMECIDCVNAASSQTMHSKNIYYHIQKVQDVPEDNNWLISRELEKLNTFKFPKRKNDWRVGRWTVKNLLQKYFKERPLTDFEIIAAEDGAPEAFLNGKPAGVSISISHSNGISLCALDPQNGAIGCDIEAIENRSLAFLEDFFTQAEKDKIRNQDVAGKNLLPTLIWSAKESTLKVLREGLRLDTRLVEVKNIKFTQAESWQNFSVFHKESVFQGSWRIHNNSILTVVTK